MKKISFGKKQKINAFYLFLFKVMYLLFPGSYRYQLEKTYKFSTPGYARFKGGTAKIKAQFTFHEVETLSNGKRSLFDTHIKHLSDRQQKHTVAMNSLGPEQLRDFLNDLPGLYERGYEQVYKITGNFTHVDPIRGSVEMTFDIYTIENGNWWFPTWIKGAHRPKGENIWVIDKLPRELYDNSASGVDFSRGGRFYRFGGYSRDVGFRPLHRPYHFFLDIEVVSMERDNVGKSSGSSHSNDSIYSDPPDPVEPPPDPVEPPLPPPPGPVKPPPGPVKPPPPPRPRAKPHGSDSVKPPPPPRPRAKQKPHGSDSGSDSGSGSSESLPHPRPTHNISVTDYLKDVNVYIPRDNIFETERRSLVSHKTDGSAMYALPYDNQLPATGEAPEPLIRYPSGYSSSRN